ncbi:hypothetical protein HRG_002933 [Hirsutella rhossiliensis]|uniref:Uncharacterized protein n=1 Tax=Hirsutella rhossiliensis TaxID=111463 RepID=A0A9P8N5B0_9HYPO|nr:uncharacterized protein HRG_02933 [Hirsutella rhossiliensis]KAH0964917.1 hypothetical protein HRG_02933 [Hirsutella rhossiliensis]
MPLFLFALLGLQLSAWSEAATGHEPALELVRKLELGTGNISWFGYRDAKSGPTPSGSESCDVQELIRCTRDESDEAQATAWGCWWLAANMETLKEPVAKGVRSICGSKDKHPDCCISWPGELPKATTAELQQGVVDISKGCLPDGPEDTDPLLAFDERNLAMRGFVAHRKLDSSVCTPLCLSSRPGLCSRELDVELEGSPASKPPARGAAQGGERAKPETVGGAVS